MTIYGATSNDFLPWDDALMVGDLNGDGLDDLILGTFFGDGPLEARVWAGEAYIIFGSSSFPATIDLNTSGEDVTIYGATAADYLTYQGSMTVGDLNGDGLEDLILGANRADGPLDARSDAAGEAYVIFGSASLPATIDLASSDEDVTIYGASAGDLLTRAEALTVGDLDGDGIDDLVLGAFLADGPSETRTDAGEAYVIFGSSSLPATIDLATSDEDVTIFGASAGDRLSWSALNVGDFNDDGLDDLLLGANEADGPSEGRTNAGEAYVIFGSGISTTSTVSEADPSGDPLPEEYGTARTIIDFDSGDSSSLTTVTLTREDTAVVVPDLTAIADVTWDISTDRTSLTADVTFEYLESEITGLDESMLAVYSGSTVSGPFTRLPTLLDSSLNVATVFGLTGFSIFILIDVTDIDGDTLPDLFETNTGNFVSVNDTGTNPFDEDWDEDGLLDGHEVLLFITDPYVFTADSDSDGLPDIVETNDGNFIDPAHTGTNPSIPDTDEDTLLDGEEVVELGTNPNEPDGDTDGDGLLDVVETNTGIYLGPADTGTDPNSVDSDGDTLEDGDEVLSFGTDPTNTDTDRDGLPDNWEQTHGFDPLVPNGSEDPDGDGLTNFGEYTNNTNPNNAHSDIDGVIDGEEVALGTDPNDPGSVPQDAKWVDFGYPDGGSGTFSQPFNTLTEGIAAAPWNGLIRIKADPARNWTSEIAPIGGKKVRIKAVNGIARIGITTGVGKMAAESPATKIQRSFPTLLHNFLRTLRDTFKGSERPLHLESEGEL